MKLDDLVGEIEIQIDDTFSYIDTQTGEVITLSIEELSAAEDERTIEYFPDWQRENIEKAKQILEDEDGIYLDFTLRNEYHEYEIIEEFIGTISKEEIRKELYEAIRGRGAFRRFKDGIRDYDIEKQWYEFKDKKLKELVIEWCKTRDIAIME